MGYFTETMSMLEACKKKDFSAVDSFKDGAFAALNPGALWAQCFSTQRYLTYTSKNTGKSYKGGKAVDVAYADYCAKEAAKESGIKKVSASMKAGDKAMKLFKEANKKEEYDLNKILGI